jgi:hypothetical protein
MDSDQQTRLAQQQDPELAARILRNIADLERDYLFAWGPLSERLMREAAAVAGKAASEPWVIEGTEWNVTVTSPDWRATRGVGQDAWLELADIVEDEEDHSWAAVIVSAGPTKLCLELKFRKGLAPIAQMLTGKDKPVANLLKEGFEQDGTGTRLLIPILIDAETLARGFELNDLDEALTPLKRAVEIAITAKPDLDVLIEHVRTQAKRK